MKRSFALAAPALALALMFAPPRARAQSFPFKFDSAATTNATEVWVGSSLVKQIFVTNSTTTVYWFKLYDTATTPTCNTTPVVFKGAVPASASVGGFSVSLPDGLQFQNGVGFCLTANQADSDNTAAATGVVINFAIKH
jgi:hypothetical protein